MYIEHIGIAAKNPQALSQWYIDMLGLKLLRQAGPTTYFIGFDQGACMEIYQARETRQQSTGNYTQGVTHTAFYTRDFEQTYRDLLEKGVKPAAEPVRREGLKLALMFDLEENLFHITTRDSMILPGPTKGE